ncbi:unnamed protein product [Rotaria magnacalcarata]|uniref:HTH CENPB-type domain-containing protein n=1 Tax=Rotaria magnacalcarata TaxID=392030 RepID=A0A816N5A1_9BILA|nr:unnamed protein product [Rotaria magnacalcarata]
MSSQSLSVKPDQTSLPTVSSNHAQTFSNATNHAEQYPAISNHSISSQVYNQNLSYVGPNSIQMVNYPDCRYEGTFQNGLRHGHGNFDCNKCGHKYVGSWVNDKPNGQGVSVWPNGSRYEGFWKDGLKDGYGTFNCGDSGHIYVGNFINDLMHGQGVFTSREGWQYQGSWMNDKKHGWGIMTFVNGMIHELANHLFLLFDQLLNSAELLVANIITLDFDYYNDDDDEYQKEDNNEDLTSIDGVTYSYDTMCSIVEYSKTHTFLSLRNLYKNIKYKEQLRRMKRYVDSQGTKIQKLRCIDEFVYAEFIRARESSLPVHDSDVRRLTFKKARTLNLNGFTASHHWILDFKHRHHISSRKITKHHVEDRDKILESADDFVKKVKDKLPNYTADHILNSDQSSFNYENPSTRTLTSTGEKTTTVLVKSMNAATHSYTIMPIISMLGN